MAVRVTQELVEVFGDQSTSNTRVTQLLLEIFGDQSASNARVTQLLLEIFGDQSTSNARVTQVLVEVFGPVWPDVSDDLNSWSDAIIVAFDEGYFPLSINTDDTLSLSDSVSTFIVDCLYSESSDSLLNLDDYIASYLLGHLSSESTDTGDLSDAESEFLAINLTVDESASLNNWAETLWLGSSELIYKDPSDTFGSWLDAVELLNSVELGAEVSDEFTLSDAILLRFSLRWLPGDSLNNWSDNLVISFSIPVLVSDTLNNWNSIASAILSAAPGIFESLTLAESYRLVLSHLLASPDSFSLSDSLLLKKGDITDFSDFLSLSDSITTSLFVNEFVSVSDSLNNWDDGDYQYASLAEDDYYRRYLNDRAFKLGERKTFYCDSFTMSDSVSVEKQ